MGDPDRRLVEDQVLAAGHVMHQVAVGEVALDEGDVATRDGLGQVLAPASHQVVEDVDVGGAGIEELVDIVDPMVPALLVTGTDAPWRWSPGHPRHSALADRSCGRLLPWAPSLPASQGSTGPPPAPRAPAGPPRRRSVRPTLRIAAATPRPLQGLALRQRGRVHVPEPLVDVDRPLLGEVSGVRGEVEVDPRS